MPGSSTPWVRWRPRSVAGWVETAMPLRTDPPGPRLQAFYLGRDDGFEGERFALLHLPPGDDVRASVLFIHAFAEEMNRSRRMAALQARALACLGVAVLQIDLAGCGDSAGDFGDATWDAWLQDVRAGHAWLEARHGHRPWLWGLRVGTLLAAQALPESRPDDRLLLWQPVADGATALRQFQRIGASGAALRGDRAEPAASTPDLLAGYRLHDGLATGMSASKLAAPPGGGTMAWFEVIAREHMPQSPALAQALMRWQASPWQVQVHRVVGPAFWTSAEIETAPALLEATTAVARRWLAA